MSDLRNRLIKFAYNHPQYRKDILPLVKSATRVQVINRQTGNTVSVNEETLRDPEKKKLYAPVEENSEKKDDGGSSSGSKNDIFKQQSKLKSDLEKWVKENDVDDILSDLDFDDIMDLENEWEDALYNLEEEDEDKAEEFKKKMEEFFKGEERQMEVRDKIDTMAEALEDDDSSKSKFVLKMLDGMGADPEDQLQNLKAVLFYVKGGYEDRKKRKDKLNKDTIDQIKTFEREGESKSMGKFHLSKEDQQKALEEYIGKIEKIMEPKSKGKKATLRTSLIRLAYNHPQYRKDILPLVKSGETDKVAAGMKLSNMRCFIDPRGKSLVIDFRADTGASAAHSEQLNAGCKEFQMAILKTAKKIGLNFGRVKGCEIEIYQNQFTLKHTAYFDYSAAVDAAAQSNRNNQEEMGTLDDLVQALTALGWACTVR